MDYRNSLRTALHTSTGISIGALITLMAAIFTQAITDFWILILIPISFVIIYVIFNQIRLNDRLENTENYCNYVQILLRKFTSQTNPENQFIPFSFAIKFIKKKKNQSLDLCLAQFNAAQPNDYLKYKEISEDKLVSINWSILIQTVASIGIIIGSIIFIIWTTTLDIEPTTQENIWGSMSVSIISAIAAGIVGILFSIIKKRLKKKRND